jgi:predicted nucleic acid-binding protein
MKVVVDTNVAVSGLLWEGPPNDILKWARDGVLVLVACQETVKELTRILNTGSSSLDGP